MLGIRDADHEESSPGAATLLISRLACSLVGQTEAVKILPGTRLRRAYGVDEARERFQCNFGLNPLYRATIEAGELSVAGVDESGAARAVELGAHRFFLATLFLPQMSSTPAAPHPLILAYLHDIMDSFSTNTRE